MQEEQTKILINEKVVREHFEFESYEETRLYHKRWPVMEDPQANRILYLTDPVMNLYPNLQEKAELIKNAVAFVKVMGIPKPKVAVISAVELINPNMPSTIDAACLSKMAGREQISDAIVDGPFALDTLFSQQAASRKYALELAFPSDDGLGAP